MKKPVTAEFERAQSKLIIRNASQVLTMTGDGVGLREHSAVICADGKVLFVMDEASLQRQMDTGRLLGPNSAAVTFLDARGGIVTPGLIDPHTHPVFGGQRAEEFGLRAQGKASLEVPQAGGGTFATVAATRAASSEVLADVCRRNLSRLCAWGVTTVECKTGYELTVDGELRLLEVLRQVGQEHDLEVVPTLLGAHVLPQDHRERRQDYLAQVTGEMIPKAADSGLCEYCDAVCEEGAFTPAEVEQVFEAAREHGLGLRLHAEQHTDQGAAAMAARWGAASADHLEAISSQGIAAMAEHGTVAVLLPGTALSCRLPWPPARALLDAGVDVALGTDLNPGSSMTASLPLMMSLGCMQMQMSCEEVWRAVTVNAARSLGRQDRVGCLAPGYQADIVIFDAPDYRYVPYCFGENHARTVIKAGRVVLS